MGVCIAESSALIEGLGSVPIEELIGTITRLANEWRVAERTHIVKVVGPWIHPAFRAQSIWGKLLKALAGVVPARRVLTRAENEEPTAWPG